jgi:predicted DNA-binding helix-hairpin-helix protein
MDPVLRLKILSEQMSLELDVDKPVNASLHNTTTYSPDAILIHPALLPNGQRIKLLKTLLTSTCERDCYYCPFRAGRDLHRATFQPDEFAKLFMLLAAKGIADGIFLSSGVSGGGIRSQDKLLDTADLLRRKYNFDGYLHLKIMPGSERSQVERAMLLANRVSVNLEAPNDSRLRKLAPHKQFIEELLQPLKWVEEIRRTKPGFNAWSGHWPSSVTQFVAGGAGETDLELLITTDYLFRILGLKRAYFSPFNPIPDTPFENLPPTPVVREHRLYQASFLIRDYGFRVEELPFEPDGRLPINTDPKLAWAENNLRENPVDINQAEKRQLIRVPGIGPRGVEYLLKARRMEKIRDISKLKHLGIHPEKAAPFILIDGRKPDHQLTFF